VGVPVSNIAFAAVAPTAQIDGHVIAPAGNISIAAAPPSIAANAVVKSAVADIAVASLAPSIITAVHIAVPTSAIEVAGIAPLISVVSNHVRQQIRKRMQGVISDNVSLVDGRVYTSRVYSINELSLPAITISFVNEVSSQITIGLRTLTRKVDIMIDVYAAQNADLDDVLDNISVQVDEAIASNFTLDGLAKQCTLASSDFSFEAGTDSPIGVARLSYEAIYVTGIDEPRIAR